ncbi:unnamed protein product [Microthlaspi erraticum]|uniref:Uncharacterized protein n=1 Tax=Microthlaspi erraticum TaxID=1685480 RepID=A0A6D2ICQ4_9BRAS|nr:unnamed protein product [Microthlaspi erraticum]
MSSTDRENGVDGDVDPSGNDNSQVAAFSWVSVCLAWVKMFFCGRDGDDVEAPLLAPGRVLDEENAVDDGVPNTSVEPRAVPAPAGSSFLQRLKVFFRRREDRDGHVEAGVGNEVESTAWKDFVKEGNTYIKWMMGQVFLFVPARYYLIDKKEGVPSFAEMELYLPEFFLPTISLYAGFMMGSKIFERYVPATIGVFLFVLVAVKICEQCVSR